jgi:hypothetical protein
MDKTPETWNFDFLSGPLSAESLGGIVRNSSADFSPSKRLFGKDGILTPTRGRRHWREPLRMDSVTIRLVRFDFSTLFVQPHSRVIPYLHSFQSVAITRARQETVATAHPRTNRIAARRTVREALFANLQFKATLSRFIAMLSSRFVEEVFSPASMARSVHYPSASQ